MRKIKISEDYDPFLFSYFISIKAHFRPTKDKIKYHKKNYCQQQWKHKTNYREIHKNRDFDFNLLKELENLLNVNFAIISPVSTKTNKILYDSGAWSSSQPIYLFFDEMNFYLILDINYYSKHTSYKTRTIFQAIVEKMDLQISARDLEDKYVSKHGDTFLADYDEDFAELFDVGFNSFMVKTTKNGNNNTIALQRLGFACRYPIVNFFFELNDSNLVLDVRTLLHFFDDGRKAIRCTTENCGYSTTQSVNFAAHVKTCTGKCVVTYERVSMGKKSLIWEELYTKCLTNSPLPPPNSDSLLVHGITFLGTNGEAYIASMVIKSLLSKEIYIYTPADGEIGKWFLTVIKKEYLLKQNNMRKKFELLPTSVKNAHGVLWLENSKFSTSTETVTPAESAIRSRIRNYMHDLKRVRVICFEFCEIRQLLSAIMVAYHEEFGEHVKFLGSGGTFIYFHTPHFDFKSLKSYCRNDTEFEAFSKTC